MYDRTVLQPLFYTVAEKSVLKIFAPYRAIGNIRLYKAGVQVQQSDKSRPFPRPIPNGKNRPSVTSQPGKQVLAELPDSNCHNDRRIRVYRINYIQTHALIPDESVTEFCRIFMGAMNRATFRFECFYKLSLHSSLYRPISSIGNLLQVAVCDKKNIRQSIARFKLGLLGNKRISHSTSSNIGTFVTYIISSATNTLALCNIDVKQRNPDIVYLEFVLVLFLCGIQSETNIIKRI